MSIEVKRFGETAVRVFSFFFKISEMAPLFRTYVIGCGEQPPTIRMTDCIAKKPLLTKKPVKTGYIGLDEL